MCPRRYWLQVFEAPLGKPSDAPPELRELWIQRNLLGRAQFIGLTVHSAAEWYVRSLKDGRRVDPRGIVARAMSEARRTLEHSAADMFRGDPKTFRGFDAHYYDVPLDGDAVLADIETQIQALFVHPVLARLEAVPKRIREVEKLTRIRLVGVDIWVSPDVVVTDGDGGFVIVDWKTGKMHHPDDVDGQLGIYGMYVLSNYLGVDVERGDLPLHRVRGLYAHPIAGAHRTVELRVQDVDAALHAIRASADRMSDPSGDVPDREQFPKVRAGDPACEHCSFRRYCGRE